MSDGKPERINALITADGPGTTVKEMPSLIHICISGYPGSDISGAPASDKSATVSPLLMSLIISSVASFSLCSWNGLVFFLISKCCKSFETKKWTI